jgi:hypothetical protein
MDVTPRYDLPWFTWRALHSGFLDFAIQVPQPMQDAFIIRLGGDFSFARFMLAVHVANALNITTIVDGDEILIGVAVPVTDGPDWVLFTLDQKQHGATAEWLMTAGSVRIDEQIDELLNT